MQGIVYKVAFHPAHAGLIAFAQRLFSTIAVQLTDMATGKSIGLPHEQLVEHIAFSQDGTRLHTVDALHTKRVWDSAGNNVHEAAGV